MYHQTQTLDAVSARNIYTVAIRREAMTQFCEDSEEGVSIFDVMTIDLLPEEAVARYTTVAPAPESAEYRNRRVW